MRARQPRPMVVGNWKMNGLSRSRHELERLIAKLEQQKPRCEVWLCPPATLLSQFAAVAKGSPVRLGAQDCHVAPSGAHTGDLSAEMLKDVGARAVILGHSERRKDHGETDALVRLKVEAAFRAGLLAIVCVGETETERDAGRTTAVIRAQLEGSIPATGGGKIVVAYEPVWAIGTGRTPKAQEIVDAHREIRELLAARLQAEPHSLRVLYGGSVKPDNAAPILSLPGVDGALVGGASLKASDFLAIIRVYAR